MACVRTQMKVSLGSTTGIFPEAMTKTWLVFEDMAKDAEQQGAAKDAEQQGAAKDAEQRGARDESAVEDLDETAEIAQVFLTHPLHIAMDTC